MVMVMVMVIIMSQCHNVTMLSAHGDVQQWSHITIQCSLYVKYCMRQHFFAVCVCHYTVWSTLTLWAARHYHHRTHMPCHDGRAFGGETQRNKFLDKTHCRRISTEEIEQNLVSKLIFRKSIRSYKLLLKMFSENKKVVYFAQKIQILLVFDDLVCQ